MWVTGLVSAFSVKLMSSIDDVVWLAPFLTSNSSSMIIMQNTGIYTSVCLIQTLVAMAIAYSGRAAVKALTGGNKHAWSTEKILTTGAGILMALYSIKLLYEYINECGEEDEPEKADPSPESGRYDKVPSTEEGGVEMVNANPAAQNIDSPFQPEDALERADKEKQQTLFVLAFIGSVDDLTLFVPMLVGKGFDVFQLMAGAIAAAATIVSFCIFIGLCKPIADCLSKIPLCLIVATFAVVLLLKAFVFDEETTASKSA